MALADIPITELELSVRTANCMKAAGVTNLGQLFEIFERDHGRELLQLPHLGRKSYNELREVVRYMQPKNAVIEWASNHVREITMVMSGRAVIVPTLAAFSEIREQLREMRDGA